MKAWRLAKRIEMPLFWASVAALAGAIFVADVFTDRDIVVCVLDVAVVLIAVQSGNPRAVLMVGASCSVLTILSFFLTRGGAWGAGVANTSLGVAAISSTTYLAIKIQSAEARLRQAQLELAHMSRVTSMGELSASVVHEVSQPLAAITANGGAAIRWLAGHPPNLDEAGRALDRVVSDAARAGDVIARLRSFMRSAAPSWERLDVDALVLEVLVLVRSEIQTGRILLRTLITPDLPPVMGDRVQLQQVVLNLVLNAIEAMDDADAGPRELLVGLVREDGKVVVKVCDTGPGLSPGDHDKVFNAFYTTKPTGMGMGLAISRSIIEAHGGRIFAAPNLPRGTIFGFSMSVAGAKEA